MLVNHGSGLEKLKEELYRFKLDNLNGEIAFDQTLVVTDTDWVGATKAAITVSERLIQLELDQKCVPASNGLDYWQSWYDAGFSAAGLLWVRPRIFQGYAQLFQVGRGSQVLNSLRLPHISINTSSFGHMLFSVAKWVSLNLKRVKLLLTRPFAAEIDSERQRAFLIQRESAKKIGSLLLNPWSYGNGETYEDVVRKTLGIMSEAYDINTAVSLDTPKDVLVHLQRILDRANSEKIPTDLIPALWQRYWPAGLIGIYAGLSVLGNWQAIVEWLQTSVLDTVKAFFLNWVVSPLHTVYNTIRHDPNSTVALMGKQSLMSDLDSLERMVTDFVLQQGDGLSPEALDTVREAARQGDLSPVLKVYEKQIQSPITSLITGGLLRTMSIQIQKAKVDAEITVAGIDKMLQSQQLVFGLIALLPGLFVVQRLFGYLTRTLFGRSQSRQLFASRSTKEQLMVRLGNIEELANGRDQFEETEIGLVYTEVARLKADSRRVLSKRRFRLFSADLDQLVGVQNTAQLKERFLMLYAKFSALESSNNGSNGFI